MVRLVFVLAHNCGKELASEQQEHGDLLYVDVRESYFTLTPKVRSPDCLWERDASSEAADLRFAVSAFLQSLALLRAGLEMNAQYIMKTDDDSFIFVDRVVSELGRLRSSQGTQGHQPCLYWGRRCSVPLLSDYNNPKLPLFQTSVSKWYYPPHYLR